jgi:UPF0755 protein
MRKRRSSLFAIFSLLLLAAACLGLLLAAAFLASYIPQRAEQLFGPPAPGLSLSDRVILSARLLVQQNDLIYPADPAGVERSFPIELGEPAASIIGRLQSDGLVPSADAFRIYLQYTGLDTTIQAGAYRLSPGMTPVEIARALQDATPTEVSFNILPGWRAEEIAGLLPTSGLNITPEAFRTAASLRPEGYSFSADLPQHASAEGFLFPGAYTLPRDLDTTGMLKTLLDGFNAQALTAGLVEGFNNQGLSIYEAVTLASIVQREAMSEEEMPLIASVFLNRLAAGMKLDSDPTVQYALGYNPGKETWWTNPLSLEDLQFDSPYNTYLYPGLPPGPIANPGLAALQAVAFPAQTPYYYFRADCGGEGKHAFAETFEEHIQNECR